MHSLSHPTRRRWVKQFIIGTATTLVGLRGSGNVCAEVTTSGPGAAVIRLKVADLLVMIPDEAGTPRPVAVLAVPGGSVQYQFNTGFPPFTLTRVESDRFVTLDSVCKHQGCTVGRYKSFEVGMDDSVQPPVPIHRSYMYCRCHGSRYDIEGRVFRDAEGVSTEPAKADLNRFQTSYDPAADIVSITIPDLALHIRSTKVERKGPGEMVRLKLEFPVTAFSEYEISHTKDFTTPSTPVRFSLTPNGVADQTSLSTFSDQLSTVYVDAEGASGFFMVGLVLKQAQY
ncbi:Rieske 2Fe-2S domain-containing protein [Luteolibacter yonseiensis]|uniref:Rieske 2Fe-2S domain-containing protein n=1 Tax=Luteolibacter yonseiensis TaxID=1144680 RepID=A0A934R2Y4_9BACT|nr:Rieske 2Fe-2S domain-containing protein [Luteolibacter yonseiensis]MBK1815894.1 Rieske 2Fe-2S domain-containing protein [Luteolibacter yonseiensis]